MLFNLFSLHMGDALMALPAMRSGDRMALREQHRFPGAPVQYVDEPGGLFAFGEPGQQRTSAWLEASGRDPVRHQLMPERERELVVIAPAVAAPRKQWTRWEVLRRALPGALWIDGAACRARWMDALSRAVAVICPDTGTAHMADALGVPKVVALHGARENWPRYAPYWGREYCVVRDSMDDIQVPDVLEKVHG